MTEPLSSGRVDEIRSAIEQFLEALLIPGDPITLDDGVLRGALALCDTVESLRAGLGIALGTANEVIEAQNAEIVELRTELETLRDKLVAKRRHAPGCLHKEPGVTICICEPVESVELKTLRGIAKRNADGWTAHRHRRSATWWRPHERERMTPAEVHAIYGTEESNDV